jgi:ribonuclease BN (tRNA processing enzyme)
MGGKEMQAARIQFLGSGDAFGHGGRLQTCILVQTSTCRFLIDFGASGMIGLYRYNIDPNSIDLILLTHLHGDHFGGLPFFILDAQLNSKRTDPLVIAGPTGIRKRLTSAMELMFPGSSKVKQRFDIEVDELQTEKNWLFCGVTVTPYTVQHLSGDPSFALRIECNGKTIAYTGDTEWTEVLLPAASQVDLLIAEAYFYEKQIKYHLNYQTLMAHLEELNPKRLIITHMGQDMLDRLEQLDVESANDGMIVEI